MTADLALTSLVFGLFSAASPCVFPLYPGFLAYLAGRSEEPADRRRYFLGFFVLFGVLAAMLAVGGLLAALSLPLSTALRALIPLADAVLILLGIALLAGRNPFAALPQVTVPFVQHPFLNAFVYGLLYGPITLPCSGPLAVAVFALSFTAEEAAAKVWVFLWFGLGLGVPLLILSLASSLTQRKWTALFARHSTVLSRIGGALLIGVAVYDLIVNGEMILRAFS